MAKALTPGAALVAFLKELPSYLQTPDVYPALLEAAPKTGSATSALIINSLMGPGRYYNVDAPTKPPAFPADHRLHLANGTEWYWLSCNLAVEGSDGLDRIGVLVVQTRNRAVPADIQKQAGWSDTQAQIVDTAATVTLATRAASGIVRRSPNTQWPPLGGTVEFSAAGKPFLYRNGSDVMSGSVDVLPLKVRIDDGSNMQIDLTMTSDLPAKSAFFLQGKDGYTPPPTPGLYYSWPQLRVQGTVAAGGKTYKVSGTGWIDHQLMMASIEKPKPSPPPKHDWQPMQGFNGWSWFQFNLDNGDALTAAAFQVGALKVEPTVSYGFYVQRAGKSWNPIYVVGSLSIGQFIAGLEGVSLPARWSYQLADFQLPPAPSGLLVEVGLSAVPWYPDGSFQTGDLAVPSETPVDVALVQSAPLNAQSGGGTALTGSGYCESVGYEAPTSYAARALAYLAEH